jgi:hypothetical protein
VNQQQPAAAPQTDIDTTLYRVPLDATDRDDLLAALRTAADATQHNLGCAACLTGDCADDAHQTRMGQVRAWRALAADIGRLPADSVGDPWLISFDAAACRRWLRAGAAQQAGIDEGFNSEDSTIAAGLEELLPLLNGGAAPDVWETQAHLCDVQIWRTADSDGVDGGGVLTADLSYMGQRVRLASLHQGSDEFTDDPATAGIDAAVQALAHVAQVINQEYVTFVRATGCPTPEHDLDNMWTVVGVWIDDVPVPVGVIAGQHEVTGGDIHDEFEQGLWATSVTADHDYAAEEAAVAQMLADNE